MAMCVDAAGAAAALLWMALPRLCAVLLLLSLQPSPLCLS
jgi:hypothetical protein